MKWPLQAQTEFHTERKQSDIKAQYESWRRHSVQIKPNIMLQECCLDVVMNRRKRKFQKSPVSGKTPWNLYIRVKLWINGTLIRTGLSEVTVRHRSALTRDYGCLLTADELNVPRLAGAQAPLLHRPPPPPPGAGFRGRTAAWSGSGETRWDVEMKRMYERGSDEQGWDEPADGGRRTHVRNSPPPQNKHQGALHLCAWLRPNGWSYCCLSFTMENIEYGRIHKITFLRGNEV